MNETTINDGWQDYGSESDIETGNLIPEGERSLRIANIKKTQSSRSGHDMWEIEIEDPQVQGVQKIKHWQTFPPKGSNPFVEKLMLNFLGSIGAVKRNPSNGNVMFNSNMDTTPLIGKLFTGTVFHEDNADFGKQARIKNMSCRAYEGPGFGSAPQESSAEIPF